MPVLVPLAVTLPLNVTLRLWLVMETASAPLAWEIEPPHVMALAAAAAPVTLNVVPAAPESAPPVVPQAPLTEVSVTPFVPPLDVTLLNVPVTVPVLRLSAETPVTLTVPPMVSVPKLVPLMAVVGGATLPMVTLFSVMIDVPRVDSA